MKINIFSSFVELNDSMDEDYLKIARGCNILKLGDPSDIMSHDWYRNTYLPRIKNLKIINYIVDEGYEKIDGFNYIGNGLNLNIDSEITEEKFEDRIRAKLNLLNFEKSFLLQNHRKEEDVLVYYGNKTKIKYSYKKNRAKKIIFIFQSAWAEVSIIHNNREKITDQIYKDITKHDKYQFYSYSKNNLDYDFVFIQDDNSYIYGWFTWNAGNCIVEDHVNFIEKFSEQYEEAHIVGASKGGYGALHIGKNCSNIDSINLLAPIVSLSQYRLKTNYQTLFNELSSTNDKDKLENFLEKVESIERTENIPMRVNCITGEEDYDYENIKKIEKKVPNFNCEYVDKDLKHGEIISNNYKEFLEKNLNLK